MIPVFIIPCYCSDKIKFTEDCSGLINNPGNLLKSQYLVIS
jgi:hypothetical protein